ncbi:MAG: hypothetical protein WC332_00595 [Clostridia bacterium]
MKKLIVALILLLAVPVQADYKFAENWTWKDTAYEGVFLTIIGVDYLQTRTQAKNNWYIDGHQYRESCPLMPEHPNTNEVDTHFAICAIGHTVIALALPPEAKIFDHKVNPRRIWQMIWIGVEAGYAVNNYSVGVRIEL